MHMFDKFHNRVVINADLVALTPIFVGAKGDSFKPGEVNGSCVKDAYGKPYIPGSSIKGVLRAFLANVLQEKVGSEVNKAFQTKDKRDEVKKQCYGGKIPATQDEAKEERYLTEKIYKMSTEAERLFGSQMMAGKVKIADATLKEDVITEVRNGVAINRDTHTAINGALFDTEVIPSGTVLRFTASAENLTVEEAAFFGQLMEYFAEGNISVGGRSRAGLGNVELQNVQVKIYKVAEKGDFPKPESIHIDGSAGIREAVCKCSQN